ncbi:cell surface family protein [Bacteroides pyogenes F0041]|uniref:Cell surface family protein n=1 Tax=Bacteroides pyogenes F0041 TaxID=1321819 RepID=U2DQE0_9BACE|nr:Mfa1 family fimbria major subunit [Bacteroides pyogenes]ERI81931.1 cell surface family protein [Bacteroides pyogenes F0041]MBB3895521.1 hypothetical protein [Bacteroides pyogenes]GAE21968.1 hypothetical protein JCM10003_1492 [Bacteroides pyogenes JCM 10003]SUV34484.1 Major fimbrial subunit protein (FimA) [Bacteroides pyogenes]
MKTNKFLVMAAMALGLGVFAACSNDDDLGGKPSSNEGTTYMSITLSMPQSTGTRADGQNQANPEYNYLGQWAGLDEIKEIEIYVFNSDGDLEPKEGERIHKFKTGEFQMVAPNTDNTVSIKPLKGIKVLPGEKTVYVVVNPTTESTALLNGKTKLTEFKVAYEGALKTLTAEGNASTTANTVADKIAKIDSDSKKDVILMTVTKAGTVKVEEGISEATTLNDPTKNRAKVEVKRAVARVMITTKKETYEVKGDDALTPSIIEPDALLGTISDIKYVVAQGEKALYFQQKVNEGNENLSIETVSSSFVPSGKEFYTARDHYDYTGLWRGYSTSGISGITVPTKILYDENKDTALGNISDDLKKSLWGEFILPNTHTWGATQDATGYRKGNTAYVLVRAKFKPAKVVMADGEVNTSYPENQDFYLGRNGVFYENNEVAHDVNKKGVKDQRTTRYVKGKVLYYAWVNPDKNTIGWLNSPVVRNNIYHIEITGFKRIGGNWNPLVPPTDPNNPEDPNDPNNPDPKPENPYEPQNPPVDPNDPLTPKETWMSVETVVLPWQVHSYSVELGD